MPLCCFWISQHHLASAFAAQAALFDLLGPSAFCGKARDAPSVQPMRYDIHERKPRALALCTALESRTDWLEPWLELSITRHYFEGFLATTLLSLLVLLLMASCPPNLRGPQSSRRARVRAVVTVFSTVVVIVEALNHWRCIGL